MKTINATFKYALLLLCFLNGWQQSNAQTTCTDPTANYQYDNSADPDDCCWFINLSNTGVSNTITAIGLDNFVDCQIGQLTANGGWTIPSQTNTNATILPNTAFIQPGTYFQQMRVCLSNRTALPQSFDLLFLETDSGDNYVEYCRMNYVLDCEVSPPDTACLTTACFTPNYQSGTTTYNFDGTCSSGNGTVSYFWNFGDGNTSTAMSPNHTFTTNQNTYNVCLTTTNITATNSCTDVICMTVDSPVTPPNDCTTSCPGDVLDLVVNGDFQAGNVGFNSGLPSNCTCSAGSYCITTDSKLKCNNSLWVQVFSPTGDNYMVVDGTAGTSIWSQTVNAIAGKTYNFSFDFYPDISNGPSPTLSLNVNGTAILANITGAPDSWSTHCASYTATTNGAVTIEITEDSSTGFDDYGLDNISFTTCCDLSISLPDTMTVCDNELVQLNPTVSGAIGPVTYSWMPTTGLSNATIANPTTTATVQTTYTVTATDSLGCETTASVVVNPVVCPCDNLIVNGDFESGDTGFTSSLPSSCTCQAGSYCVTSNARNKCTNSLWQPILAPNGTGNYLVVDGNSNSMIWEQTVNVVSGSVYDFCFDYYPNVSGGPAPQLTVTAGGTAIIPSTTGTPGSWQKICVTGYSATTTGPIQIQISEGTASGFDDYGIDNIQFGACCDLTITLPDTMTVCDNDLVQLNPTVSGAIGPVTYSWMPTTGLSNALIANPTTTATVQTTYTVTATDSLGCETSASVVVSPVVCPCDNLIVNGDFENGDTGFTSSLPSSCTCQAGSYCVTNNARNKCTNSLWQPILAPNGTGNYLVVDGNSNSMIWEQTVNVVVGSVYDFCFDYYPNVSGGPAPQLTVTADGTTLITTTGVAGSWQKICFIGYTPTTTGPILLQISEGTASGFDDFGIDNIQFGYCCELSVSFDPAEVECEEGSVQLAPIVVDTIPIVSYEWSPINGLSASDVENPIATASGEYTVMVTNEIGCTASASVTVNCDTIIIDNINNLTFSTSVLVYPNPTYESVNIEFGEGLSTVLPYRLLDVLGRTIREGVIEQGVTLHNLSLDGLSDGVYFLSLGNLEEGYYQEKIIKRNNK